MDVYYLHDIWSLDLLDPTDYGAKINKNYKYVSVVVDKFPEFDWTIPLNLKTLKQ